MPRAAATSRGRMPRAHAKAAGLRGACMRVRGAGAGGPHLAKRASAAGAHVTHGWGAPAAAACSTMHAPVARSRRLYSPPALSTKQRASANASPPASAAARFSRSLRLIARRADCAGRRGAQPPERQRARVVSWRRPYRTLCGGARPPRDAPPSRIWPLRRCAVLRGVAECRSQPLERGRASPGGRDACGRRAAAAHAHLECAAGAALPACHRGAAAARRRDAGDTRRVALLLTSAPLGGCFAQAAPPPLPVWHRFCPCTRFTAFEKLPPHLADNGYIRTGYRVVRPLAFALNAQRRRGAAR